MAHPRASGPVLALLLGIGACRRGDDGDETATLAVSSLAEAPTSIRGAAGDMAGSVLGDVGDTDGDGMPDLVVGAIGGRITCVFAGPIAAGTLDLRSARTCLTQEAAYDFAGQAVAAEDLDGDGRSDLLIGGPGADPAGEASGKVWLLAGPLPGGEVSVGVAARVWTGAAAADAAGSAVAFPGDVDGDGGEDLLVGVPGSDAGGREAGAVVLVSGDAPAGALADAATVFVGGGPAAASAAKHATTVSGDGVGSVLCRAGDLDGDGIADVVVPAPGSDRGAEDAGALAIFAGPVGAGTWTLDDADRLLVATRAGGYAGGAVACGGDTDGDGHGELLLGADADGGGRVYLWRGGTLDDAALVIEGAATEQAGFSVAFVPGDGRDAVLLGARAADLGADGAAAVDAGGVSLFRSPVASGTVDRTDADVSWVGESAGDLAGTTVIGIADPGGAGTAGFAVGAPGSREPNPLGGAAYVFRDP